MGAKGQCLLSVVPVRSEGKSQAEIVTQLLYGETYTVITRLPEWLEIKIDFDGYQGWISANQFSEPQFKPEGVVLHNKLEVIEDVIVPFAGNLPNQTGYAPEDITVLAKRLLGSPYLWGGKTCMGIDCSGFVQVIHKVKNIRLPRDASQQAKMGVEVDFRKRKAGDLAFFGNAKGKVNHVGLLVSENEIIHASGEVRIDPFSIHGIIHGVTGTQTHELFEIRRLK
ncbi:MAG: C40 family peptidase [Bacteroidetes bacterium]|jgi:hypothetical protein|nr:C40 family peptidase [Bacteroidota bacterium]